MAKKLVKKDERVVFFFGKKRKLNDRKFKVGRSTVHVFETPSHRWCAHFEGYNDKVSIMGDFARSRAAAVKKLEKRIDSLHCALLNLYENYG